MTITRMTTMAAAMAWMASAAGAAEAMASQPHQSLTAYVHNRADVRNTVLIPAEWLATEMFAKIGISLHWSAAKPARSSAQPSIVMDLLTATPPDRMPGALAYALPFEGVHISVFFDRIEEAPAPDRARILAHVMVHEITHLLQGVSRHSDRGVMKAVWTNRDFGDMRKKPLAFTVEDVNLIDSGLSARQAGTGLLVAGR
jgi:hypothetical protein